MEKLLRKYEKLLEALPEKLLLNSVIDLSHIYSFCSRSAAISAIQSCSGGFSREFSRKIASCTFGVPQTDVTPAIHPLIAVY